MKKSLPDHYATLGLHRRCTEAQIRDAYRLLAKRLHPDVNPGSSLAHGQIQAVNAAYEVLNDPGRRQEYDQAWEADQAAAPAKRPAKVNRNLTQDAQLNIRDFFHGVTLEVRVNDPGNPGGGETYSLTVPPETAPGARFKLSRDNGGQLVVRVKPRADFRFKPKGSDLRCDLRISHQRATQGGMEMVNGPTGNRLRLQIPARVERHEILRLPGQGLPKTRGGRGDLLVRIVYQPVVRIARSPARQ